MATSLSTKTMKRMKTLLMKNNVTVFSLVMFYDHRNTIKFEALLSVIYTFQETYFVLLICVCIKTSHQSTTKPLAAQGLMVLLVV